LRRALGFYEQAVALDPNFAQAWAELSSAATSLYANGTPTAALSERARKAAEKAIALAPNHADGYAALGNYERMVTNDLSRAVEQYDKGRRLAPGESRFLFATALVEQALGRWDASIEHLRQAERLNPRSIPTRRVLGFSLLRMRRYREARDALDRTLALAPTNLDAIEYKAMTYLAEGDLPAARAVLKAAPAEVEPTALVAALANYYDLQWVLEEPQRDLLLRLTPAEFDGDRGQWAASLAQAHGLKGDGANARSYAEQAAKAFADQLVSVPEDSGRHVSLGIVLAYLGRKDDAIREGERAVALDPVAEDQLWAPYIQHQLARIYMLVGEPEKALDRLEPLLKIPYYLSPGWLKIDPNFDSLRKNPRFQKLLAGS
jgi:tetratricopeptide (TPR) repeat protein